MKPILYLLGFVSMTGATRWGPPAAQSPAVVHGAPNLEQSKASASQVIQRLNAVCWLRCYVALRCVGFLLVNVLDGRYELLAFRGIWRIDSARLPFLLDLTAENMSALALCIHCIRLRLPLCRFGIFATAFRTQPPKKHGVANSCSVP